MQSGIDALENAFNYLVANSDRVRAAYLISRTREILGQPASERFSTLARGAHFPEYAPVFEQYIVKEAPAPIPVIVKAPEPKRGPPKVVSRKTWKARPTLKNVVRNQRWSKLTIHHTADQGSMVSLGSDDTAGYLRRLQQYFQKTLKYADLPYHYLISKDGKVYEGRSMKFQGAHAGDTANRENIGIALIGNFDSQVPPTAQLSSLKSLVSHLSKKHRISHAKIYPHCDLKETDCPGRALESLVRSLYGNAPVGIDGTLCSHGDGAEPSTDTATNAE